MNTTLHRNRARKAWPILVRAAATGTPLSYGDLSSRIGVHWRAASWFLGVIQRYCETSGLPRLQALAVNKRTGIPGGGYLGSRGRRAHRRELLRVQAHRWGRKAPF